MINFLQVCFWLLLFMACYSYFIYPLFLRLLPARKESQVPLSDTTWPPISIIVAARNEQASIKAKIDNLLSLPTYPGSLEIIVASDASNDDTDNIVAEFADRGVRLVRNERHDGKEAAQALAIEEALGDLLVFTDVSTSMQGDVLQRIAHHFRDSGVGALSSVDQFIDREGRPAGEGAYVRYEMWLRRHESRVSSLIGLSGSFFAVRAAICRDNWLTSVPSDLISAINCFQAGLVAISAEDVIGYYPDLVDSSKEFKRKIRTVLRGMQALAKVPSVLNPFKYGLFAFQMWSHKLLRWIVPWSLILLLPVTVILSTEHPFYRLALAGQIVFYLTALLGWLVPSAARYTLVRLPLYFVVANVAVLRAGWDFFRGRSITTWTPSAR
jgi:hypothetical protein